jgi:hypothetical protein
MFKLCACKISIVNLIDKLIYKNTVERVLDYFSHSYDCWILENSPHVAVVLQLHNIICISPRLNRDCFCECDGYMKCNFSPFLQTNIRLHVVQLFQINRCVINSLIKSLVLNLEYFHIKSEN